MLDWWTHNAWAIWVIAAAILAVAEVTTMDFTLLMLAAGALAGGAAAFLFPGAWILHAVVAVVVMALLLAVLRPTLLKKVRNAPGYRSSLDTLVGSTGPALIEITATAGEVKIGGEVWTARSYDGSLIPEGTQVEIFSVDGTTVQVYPKAHNPELR
ncbi:MAG: NfeD family protein [Propionibacteriaceae bacterium]|jgi:membrane protein implicated in regulation of membrane protease activity|nr:NfeD family protein [Micropruina sp.]HBY22995.1 NfeD family protein [Propionibacteriaceae bacterium]